MSKGIIVVDAGHGQFGNPHTTKEGFYEGTQNYILACFLKEELEKLGFTVKERVSDTEYLEYYGYTGNSCIILATGKQIKEFCEMGWIEDKYYLTLAPENLSEATEQHPMSFFFDTSNIDGYSEKLDVYFKTLVS